MKAKRSTIAILLAMTMVFSALAFTACGGTDEHKCGHVCPECGKCTSDCTDEVCKDKCEGHGGSQEAVNITEGVYNCAIGSYELLIKFYDDGTFYFQNETTGFRGKYQVKDESITYAATAEDGTILDTEQHPSEAKWVTGNKVIYFYQEDGVTPVNYELNACESSAHDANTVVAKVGYAYGTPKNALALDTENDQIISFKGGYGTRSLGHTKERDFKIENEKAIEQAKFMVKTLPDGAEAGKVESDYFLTLSQKGYSANIPALKEIIDEGTYTKNNNVYSLTDTISGETATLTIAADGKSAAVTCGSDTIELVIWQDKTAVTPTGNVILEKDLTATISENEFAGKVTFYDSGSVTISVSSVGLNVTGSYKAESGKGLTVTNIGEMTLTQSGLSLVLGGNASVGGRSAPISATITCTQEELGALVSAGASAVTDVLAKDMTASIGGNELQGTVTFKSDGTVVISVPTVGLSVTGNYAAASGQGLTVTNIGEMTLTQSGLSLVLGGNASVGGRSAPISATITCTQEELMALMA